MLHLDDVWRARLSQTGRGRETLNQLGVVVAIGIAALALVASLQIQLPHPTVVISGRVVLGFNCGASSASPPPGCIEGPVAGATIRVYHSPGGQPMTMVMSDASGSFSVTVTGNRSYTFSPMPVSGQHWIGPASLSMDVGGKDVSGLVFVYDSNVPPGPPCDDPLTCALLPAMRAPG